MATIKTYTCANCGASLATSAAPGTIINCEYCGTPFRVPQPGEKPAGDETIVAGRVLHGNPAPEPPTNEEGEGLPTPPHGPAPGTPADVGYDVDVPDVTVGREGEPQAPKDISPTLKDSGEAPTAADLIAEPTKYGAAIPSTEGETIVVPPNRVKVIPPQEPVAGGPPGSSMRSRTPVWLAGLLLLCCLGVVGTGVVCALTGVLGDLFAR